MGFGNPAAERAAIEATYEDIATISRVAPVTEGSITRQVPSVVHEGIICALSYPSGDRSKQTKAQNTVDYTATVFLPPELRIEPGDVVRVTRFGRDNPDSQIVLAFEVVGRPPVYATHQEVRVVDGDLA